MSMVDFQHIKNLEYQKCDCRHHPKDDSDKSVEQQEHQQNHRCLECRIFIDVVHLPEKIIADSHIERAIVFECLIDEIFFIRVEFLYDQGIA